MQPQSEQFDQLSPAFDLKCTSDPSLYYAVCATPRSGSHFLGHLMYATGAMGYPLEYLNPANLRRWAEAAGSTDIKAVFDYIKSRRTSPNGCFGLKTNLAALQDYPFDVLFPGCRLILINRVDLIDQAISLVRARQTNQWISMLPRQGEPSYDSRAIQLALEELTVLKEYWYCFLKSSGREYLKVEYESLVEKPEREIARVARFLGLPEVEIEWSRVLPRKQSGPESRIWRSRFCAEQLREEPPTR
jgi:LPS sulfotransferase NodH